MQKQVRLEYRDGDYIHVLRLHPGANDKTGHGVMTLGTYHFSIDSVLHGVEYDAKECMGCPRSYQGGDKSCYTRKGNIRRGLEAMRKALKRRLVSIPEYNPQQVDGFLHYIAPYVEYVRFGVHGEPITVQRRHLELMASLVPPHKRTGYTHQHRNPKYQWASRILMGSADSLSEAYELMARGWRPFYADKTNEVPEGFVLCPASKLAGKKTTCSQCGLCNGTSGSSSKPIFTPTH